MHGLKKKIQAWGKELGFDALGVSPAKLTHGETGLAAWLGAGFHGGMDYMAAHGTKRSRPDQLVPGTRSVISARMNYRPVDDTLHDDPERAFVSRYARGRDYHKLMRSRLQLLAERICDDIGPFAYRVFTDSAPVMEVELALQAGLGWRGKHTLLLDRAAGSYFFLGEIYTDLELPADAPVTDHCGTCTACIDACPTQAILAPGKLDARRCISYLTIELKEEIPERFRPALGNRIYGCDDCQSVCPWNRFAPPTKEADFAPRHGLDNSQLAELFAWSESEFNAKLAGSPIRRIGYERWLRNIAIALGNSTKNESVLAALRERETYPSPLVQAHVSWALARLIGETQAS